MNYKKCKLCKVNIADKTGSHILPYSLIRKVINVDGKKERGNEYAFGISGNRQPVTYIGPSVLPENIPEMPISSTDDPIRYPNYFVEDYIFCSKCESRLSIIESYFAEKVIQALPRLKIFENVDPTFTLKKVPAEVIHLYGLSLFWRVSVSETIRLKIKPHEEEKLRLILNKTLSTEREELLKNSVIHSAFIKHFPLVAIHIESPENHTGNPTGVMPSPTRPYILFADEYIFLLYFKISQAKAPLPNFYGISEFVDIKNIPNFNEESFIFGKILLRDYETIMDTYFKEEAEYHLSKLKIDFSGLVKAYFGKKPTPEMVNYFGQLIGHNFIFITEKHFIQAVAKTLLEFGWKPLNL